jgi:hypothetical protein
MPQRTATPGSEIVKPKTALANWIAGKNHPLTARVIANRVWQYHFGIGLVATPNDFGVNGQAPSHPELLDYLAEYLVESDWSIKSLHRLILGSATYQQSSFSPHAERAMAQDPDNRLLWRFSRRRLSAEEIRDAMLTASGRLDFRMTGPSVMVPVEQDLIDLLYKPSQWQVARREADHCRRSVYLVAKRNLRLPFLEVFDQPDLQTSCPRRESSTHAPQALEMLNGDLSNGLAAAMAGWLQDKYPNDLEQQVRQAFLRSVGGLPTADQQRIALEFLAQHPMTELALALFNSNAFMYVD